MARDATLIQLPNRETVANYLPALSQSILDQPPLAFHLKLPIAFGTADAAVLFTVPSTSGGYTIRGLELQKLYWEITADWTGGASSAIGVSSSRTGFTTKGDLLGGAAGDVAATLVAASLFAGTVGAKSLVTLASTAIIRAAETLRFDRITSAFTAGTGFVHCTGFILID